MEEEDTELAVSVGELVVGLVCSAVDYLTWSLVERYLVSSAIHCEGSWTDDRCHRWHRRRVEDVWVKLKLELGALVSPLLRFGY